MIKVSIDDGIHKRVYKCDGVDFLWGLKKDVESTKELQEMCDEPCIITVQEAKLLHVESSEQVE